MGGDGDCAVMVAMVVVVGLVVLVMWMVAKLVAVMILLVVVAAVFVSLLAYRQFFKYEENWWKDLYQRKKNQ